MTQENSIEQQQPSPNGSIFAPLVMGTRLAYTSKLTMRQVPTDIDDSCCISISPVSDSRVAPARMPNMARRELTSSGAGPLNLKASGGVGGEGER